MPASNESRDSYTNLLAVIVSLFVGGFVAAAFVNALGAPLAVLLAAVAAAGTFLVTRAVMGRRIGMG